MRSAVVVGPGNRAFIGDLDANLYALDTETGRLIWQKKADDQPFARITGTPKLSNGRLYVPIASQEENSGANPIYPCCKFRGNLVAMDARTGDVIWRSYTSPEPKPTKIGADGVQFYGPSGATIWGSPTLDAKRSLIYAVTGNGYSTRTSRLPTPSSLWIGRRAKSAGRSRRIPTCSTGIADRAAEAATAREPRRRCRVRLVRRAPRCGAGSSRRSEVRLSTYPAPLKNTAGSRGDCDV